MEKTRGLAQVFARVGVCAAMLVLFGGCSGRPHLVHVTSDPPGAVVFLNNRIIGETPFDTAVEQREGDYSIYTFKVMKEDYKPLKQAFKEQLYHETAADVIPARLHFVLEERKKYDIAITSAPSGALISLNGDRVGETPCTATIRERIGEPRVFDFLAEKEGFAQGQKIVREPAASGDGAAFHYPQNLHFELTAEPAR